MKKRSVNIFILSAGALLLITALAKFISSAGNGRILQYTDPILEISFRHVFWIVGTIELIVGMVCLFGKQVVIKVGLVVWLATMFLVYRIGLVVIDYHAPCRCMGNLTDVLHIPPEIADAAMIIILTYLLIGSYTAMFWLWQQRKKEIPASVTAHELV